MKLKLVSIAAIAALFAGQALAEDKMAVTYGNTIELTAADGTVTKVYYNEDGTYTTDGEASGTWELNESDQLCTTPAGGEQGCTDVAWGHQVGESWDATSTEGEPVNITIVEGR